MNMRVVLAGTMMRLLLLTVLVSGSKGWLSAFSRRKQPAFQGAQTWDNVLTKASPRTITTTFQPDLESSAAASSIHISVNGDHDPHPLDKLAEVTPDVDADQRLPEAPPLSYKKFLTMQEKRAVVQIRYSSDAGLKPYFLTVAKKLKTSHPDVIIERLILPKMESRTDTDEPTFEIVVDGKVVVGNGKGRPRKAKLARQDMLRGRSFFVSMTEVDIAICRARRKLRPTTVYGDRDGAADAAAAAAGV